MSRVFVLLAAFYLAGLVAAEDKDLWAVGTNVLPKKKSESIPFVERGADGKQVELKLSGLIPFKVRKDTGDGWVRIHDGLREGWVRKDNLVTKEDAPIYWNRALKANPEDRWALWMRGEGWSQKGEWDNALKDFNEYIRLEPGDPVCYNSRGVVWRGKKEYEKAIDDYTEAIRLDPKYGLAFVNRGTARSFMKEYDKAIKDFTEVIRLEPKFAHAFHSRGHAWRNKKNYDKALEDYNEAERLDPKNSLPHNSRAVVYFLTRQPKAVEEFQTALKLEGWNGANATTFVIHLHFASRQVGDEAAAKQILKDADGKLNDRWPYPIVRFLRGDISEKELLKLASDDDRRTATRCYLGLDHMLKGNKKEAADHFRWVKDNGSAPSSSAYTIAVAELERLEKENEKP